LGIVIGIIVVVLVVAWAALTRIRSQKTRARDADALAARAATGKADSVQGLGESLAASRPRDSEELVQATRRHLCGAMAPAVAAGLARGDKRVSEACATMLEELGAPGMRAAWRIYVGGGQEPSRIRVRTFMMRNPDWLAHELFGEWADAGGKGEPPHAELWRDAGLLQWLKELCVTGDPHVAPLAASLLRHLGVDVPETASAAR
jgi:hypothetical protein